MRRSSRPQTDRGLFVRTEEATTLDALVADGRRRTRPRGALHRGRPRRAVRLHRDRAESREAESAALSRRRRSSRRTRARPGRWPTSSSATSSRASRFPGIVYEYGLNQRFLPEITLAEVNSAGEGLDARSQPPRRGQRAGEGPGVACPTEAKLAAVINAASGAPLTAYVDTVSTQPLLAPLPSPGAVATTTTNDALGITEWQLSNGVRVVLKPTTFKQDEILFRAVSPGGTSLASDAGLHPGGNRRRRSSPQGGLGTLRSIDLNKVLAGTSVGCQSRHRRHGRRARRRRVAQRSRDDVSADLSHVHRAAGRSGRVRRADASS